MSEKGKIELGQDVRKKNIGNSLKKEARKIFKKTVLTVGATAIGVTGLGCSLLETKQPEIINVPIEQLAADPKFYEKFSILETSGYPQKIKEDVIRVPDPNGYGDLLSANWISMKTEIYKLHLTTDFNSTSITMIINGGITYFPRIPIEPKGSNLVPTDKYKIMGRIIKIRNLDKVKNVESYALEPKTVEKVNPEVAK